MSGVASRWSPARRRQLLVGVVLLVAVALAGCSFLFGDGGDEQPLPEGEQAAEAYLSLDGYSATAHYEYSDQRDRRARLEIDVDSRRSRVAWLAPPSRAGNVQIYNGSAVVRYNATRNEYVSISTSGLDSFEDGGDRIARAVDAARADGKSTVERPPAGGAPLPKVPAGSSADSDSDRKFEVTYEGTETVADREAHVIEYEAVGDPASGILEQTVWIDTEYYFTLKSTQVTRFDGNESTFTFRLSEVSIDPGLTESDFQFDPPSGAQRNRSSSYDVRGYDTRTQLASAVETSVPNPSVPSRFSLARADHVIGTNFTAVQLQYQTSGSRLFVTKTTEQEYEETTEGEHVSIDGQTGRYRSGGTGALVVWRCDGYVYTVRGSLQRSAMLDVARSVGCE